MFNVYRSGQAKSRPTHDKERRVTKDHADRRETTACRGSRCCWCSARCRLSASGAFFATKTWIPHDGWPRACICAATWTTSFHASTKFRPISRRPFSALRVDGDHRGECPGHARRVVYRSCAQAVVTGFAGGAGRDPRRAVGAVPCHLAGIASAAPPRVVLPGVCSSDLRGVHGAAHVLTELRRRHRLRAAVHLDTWSTSSPSC